MAALSLEKSWILQGRDFFNGSDQSVYKRNNLEIKKIEETQVKLLRKIRSSKWFSKKYKFFNESDGFIYRGAFPYLGREDGKYKSAFSIGDGLFVPRTLDKLEEWLSYELSIEGLGLQRQRRMILKKSTNSFFTKNEGKYQEESKIEVGSKSFNQGALYTQQSKSIPFKKDFVNVQQKLIKEQVSKREYYSNATSLCQLNESENAFIQDLCNLKNRDCNNSRGLVNLLKIVETYCDSLQCFSVSKGNKCLIFYRGEVISIHNQHANSKGIKAVIDKLIKITRDINAIKNPADKQGKIDKKIANKKK